MSVFFELPFIWRVLFGFVLGACIGSFLTVVIFRYPKMLLSIWRKDCAQLCDTMPPTEERLNLALPRSRCTTCKQSLSIWHNLPLIGFILLRGRCGFCKHKISYQYALVEWLAALLSAWALAYFGFGIGAFASMVTTYFLLALGFIDLNERLLPDQLTLSLLWLGLLFHMEGLLAGTYILGAVGGYLIPWLFNWLFILIRKKPGMGHGDFKLLAAIGAWVGLTGAITCYVAAAFLSLFVAIPLLLTNRLTIKSSLPFGPFICLAGWAILNFYPDIERLVNSILLPSYPF